MSAAIMVMQSPADEFYLQKVESIVKTLGQKPGVRKHRIKLIKDEIMMRNSQKALRLCVEELLYCRILSLDKYTSCELLNLAVNL